MSKKDILQRFIFDKAPVRGEYIHLQESFETILNQHAYPLPVRQLLGEALCVAGLLSAIIKFEGRVTVQFRGKSNLKLLLAQCDNNFHLRGLAKWEGGMDYADLMESLQDGVLVIMLDSGTAKGPYQGIVSWRGNSLAASVEGYFRDSEQLATKIWLAVDDTSAAGFLIQVIPTNKEIRGLEEEVVQPHWEHLSTLSDMISPADLLHLDYEALLRKLYPNEDVRIFEGTPVSFQCTCSRKRGADAILILGKEEAEAELKTNRSIVVTCDFCNKEYVFDNVDVAKIFKDDEESQPPPNQLH